MRAPKRRIDPGLIQQLAEQPERFGFFQAMRLLEHMFQQQGDSGADALARRVRFRNTLSLSFPSSDIEQVELQSAEGEPLELAAALEHALATEDVGQVHITPSFMGLLGAHGALPLHYTELLASRETYERDRAARAFLDIFTTRAVALHYGAWKKHRLAMQYELDRRERFLPLVMALAGLGLPGLRDRLVDGEGAVFDQAIAHNAAGVRQRPVSAAFAQKILSGYFDTPIRLEQFVGAWYRVPAGQATRLGMANARLGASALAGDRVWQRDLRVRVWIGPLERARYEQFLPGGQAALALAKWLSLLTGISLEYDVRLVLRAEDVTGACLDTAGARLGWDSYLCTRPAETPRSDAGYGIHTLQ